MNPDRVYIVILLVIGIIVLSNVMMFALVRGLRGVKFDWFGKTRNTFNQPFKHEDDSLDELRRRVQDLSTSESSSDEDR